MGTVATFAGATLAHPAGASRLRMIADGMPFGGIKSSYRTAAEQQRLYDGWLRRLPGYNFALPPSQSKHVQGLAIDMVVTSAAHKWMLVHAAAYGWYRTNPAEPWHWEYSGVTPTDKGEDDMATAQEVWETPVIRGGKSVAAIQELADAKTQGILVNGKADAILAALSKAQAPVIDYTKLAAAMPKPEPIDYAKLAKAVNDDAARRMQG